MPSLTKAPDTALLVVNRIGTVHAARYGVSCTVAAHAAYHHEISTLQAFVYKLAPCRSCFIDLAEFERLVGRKVAKS